MKKISALMVAAFFLTSVFIGMALADVTRITKEELKAKMEKGEEIIILDTRWSYDSSKVKIKGAIRIAPNEVETRYKELPRDKEIITYCT